jgi:hypothetical protein
VAVTFRPEINQLVLESIPYATFDADVTTYTAPNTYTVTPTGTNPNLYEGCQVYIAFEDGGGVYRQVPAVVTSGSLSTFDVALINPADAALFPVLPFSATVIPQTVEPLVLYMQRSPTDASTISCAQGYVFPRKYGRAVDAEIIGFDAQTYESCGKLLTSPGTLEKWHDSYILLCLAFAAGHTPAVTGDVYYPMPKQNTIVFAKVLRGSCFLRADFDRVFDHHFNGSGQHLGYIRVQILNPNGTPYQTHGHTCSITLKFESRASTVAFGDGHTVVPGEGRMVVAPLARGTVTYPSQDYDFDAGLEPERHHHHRGRY